MQIPKPCQQNYGRMAPAQNGRHCAVCNKEVIDFTQITNAEVIAYFNIEAHQNTCGRFNRGQVKSNSAFGNTLYSLKTRVEGLQVVKPVKIVLVLLCGWLLMLSGCFMGAVKGEPRFNTPEFPADSTAIRP